ncbi:syncoilin isoform 2-T2 [Rhinophrynus dorsalis]
MSSAEEEGESSQGERPNAESPLLCPSSPAASGSLSLEDVGVQFQFCIAAVEDLERERDELIRELTLLREPSLEAVRMAHEEVVQAFGQRAQVELERDALREEVQGVRCRLFKVTRDYVACQYKLENQRRELAEKAAQREDLEILATRLTEELTQLRNAIAEHREGAQQKLRAPHARRTSRELQDRRRLSAELQSLTEEQHNSLEEQYEPRLLRLLDRCDRGAEALRVVQQELQMLREELRPLQAEACRLRVQKSSLQEQTVLLKRKRGEEVLLYRVRIPRVHRNRCRSWKIEGET